MIEQYYIVVKSSVHSSDTAVFNLTQNELSAITKRHGVSDREVINGVLVKANPLLVINSLSELGYRVVCSSGEGEVVWTLTRGVVVVSPPFRKPRRILKENRVTWADTSPMVGKLGCRCGRQGFWFFLTANQSLCSVFNARSWQQCVWLLVNVFLIQSN
ncbi:hypothetical protein AAG570_002042 [Ranatra chinensis]|uniref:Uncharacterized protein n=1 Tax=Ranatra chinensis TaxID=642074 RepID=A0ABD0YM41_9HEMI